MSYNNSSDQYYQPAGGRQQQPQHHSHHPQQHQQQQRQYADHVYYNSNGVASNNPHFHEPLHLDDYMTAGTHGPNMGIYGATGSPPMYAQGVEQWPDPAAGALAPQQHYSHYYGQHQPANISHVVTMGNHPFMTNMVTTYYTNGDSNNTRARNMQLSHSNSSKDDDRPSQQFLYSSDTSNISTSGDNNNQIYTNYLPSDFDPIEVSFCPAQHQQQQQPQYSTLLMPCPPQQFSYSSGVLKAGNNIMQPHDSDNNTSETSYNNYKAQSPVVSLQNPKNDSLPQDPTAFVPQPKELTEKAIFISGISETSLSYTDVKNIVAARGADVITKYLPCVEFLVICQQELRRAVEKNQKASAKHRFSTKQFYNTYLHPLTDRFYRKNIGVMPNDHLQLATKEIHKLLAETKKVEYLGCDHMKVTFLGGMREGQSWGLRNWLSKHGSALQACNELEMVLTAVQRLDPSSETTIHLAAQLRKEASYARDRLIKEVPKAYQQFSNAHPFLPFFHRLESALKGLADFDPEDDDVVILDNVEQEKMKASASKKRAFSPITDIRISNKRSYVEIMDELPTCKRTNSSNSAKAENSNTCAVKAIDTGNGNQQQACDEKRRSPLLSQPTAETAREYNRSIGDEGDCLEDEQEFEEIRRLFDGDSNRLEGASADMCREYCSPGDWRCVNCTYMNASCVDFCLMCEVARASTTSNNASLSYADDNTAIDKSLLLF